MKKYIVILVVLAAIAISISPVLAQDGGGIWDGILNPDGTINTGNLNDQGVISEPVSWMPEIPGVGPIDAEYHIYTTATGETVVMPTTSTMVFMLLNTDESGITQADANYGNGIFGLAAVLTDAGIESFPNGVDATEFADALISGETNIWALGGDVFGLLKFLAESSFSDQSLYNVILLYTAENCASAPGGCPPEVAEAIPTELPVTPPPPGTCPAPKVIPGEIHTSGEKTGPAYPLVVGQDPDKRGVDLLFTASVDPTIYIYYVQVPKFGCRPGYSGNGNSNCTVGGGPGHREQTGWECEKHQETFPEGISLCSGTARLTSESRSWIVNELSIRYPGAYVHKPSFSWPPTGGGGACTISKPNTQIQDPGAWDLIVSGQTTGTPVSASRGFGGPAGSFKVWLKETAIIE
jgi:hypothetical protein